MSIVEFAAAVSNGFNLLDRVVQAADGTDRELECAKPQ